MYVYMHQHVLVLFRELTLPVDRGTQHGHHGAHAVVVAGNKKVVDICIYIYICICI